MSDVAAPSPFLPAPSLSLNVAHQDLPSGWCVVSVEGEVDLATVIVLESALLELLETEGRARFALDLSQVGHLDSSGVATLIRFQKRLPPTGALKLVAPREHVMSALRLMGLDRRFEVIDSVAPFD